MLISYDPLSDVLNLTFASSAPSQTQVQGNVTVNFDATGSLVSVAVPNASSALWENGGQINVMLPEKRTVVVTETVV